MKNVPFFVSMLCLAALCAVCGGCVVAKDGDGALVASLGGKVDATVGKVEIKSDHDESFAQGSDTAFKGFRIARLADLAERAIGEWGAQRGAETAADVRAADGANAVELAEIGAATEGGAR